MSNFVENLINDQRLILAGISFVLVVLAGCSRLVRPAVADDSSGAAAVPNVTREIPAMDAAAPERTEKATFALG